MQHLKFAIFNGFPFHHCMFGYLLDYVKNNNVMVDIYAQADDVGWMEFYQSFFKQFNLIDPDQFDYEHLEKYDLIFLLTDDDPHFKTEKIIQKELIKKIVCIDHHGYLRNKNLTTHLATRFYQRRPQIPWSIPCFEYITLEEKIKTLNHAKQINVGMVGVTHLGEEGVIKRLIKQNPEIVIHYINRTLPDGAVMNSKNVQHHINVQGSELLSILSSCHFMLVNKAFGSKYTFDALSGAVWLAYTTGCQLIMPVIMKKAYKIKSPIGYFPFQKVKLYRPTPQTLKEVVEERTKLKIRLQNAIEQFLKY